MLSPSREGVRRNGVFVVAAAATILEEGGGHCGLPPLELVSEIGSEVVGVGVVLVVVMAVVVVVALVGSLKGVTWVAL